MIAVEESTSQSLRWMWSFASLDMRDLGVGWC